MLAVMLVACGGGDDSDDAAQPPGGQPPGNTPPPGNNPPPAGNAAPTLTGTAPSQVLVGNAYSFTPTANDADGDSLTFSVENLPGWASFDEDTGALTGTPEAGDVATYSNIGITVSDGEATADLGPFTIQVVATATGGATLTWTPPTQKTDGTQVDLFGYRVYWGTSPGSYSNSTDIGANVSTFVVQPLTPATWYFAVTAVDPQGLESDYSNEATKQIL